MDESDLPSDAPNAERLFERADLFISLSRYAEAVPLLQTVLSLDPGDVRTLAKLGWAYRALGDEKESNRYLTSALQGNAISTGELLLRTEILHSLGRRREALSAAYAAFQTAPEDVDALYALCQQQFENGKNALAQRSALQLTSLSPDFEGSYQMLALLAFRKRQWSETEKWCGEVLRCEAENSDFQALRGKALLKQGRQAAGVDAVWAAVKQAPDNGYCRASLNAAIDDVILPIRTTIGITACLSGIGLAFYLLLVLSGLPPWSSLIIAVIVFIASCPLSCWPQDGYVQQIREVAYDALPAPVQEYCALGGYKRGRAFLGLLDLAATVITPVVMLFWTIFGEPTHLSGKHTRGISWFFVEIAQLIGVLLLPFTAIMLRKYWAQAFRMADELELQYLLENDTYSINRLVQTIPQNRSQIYSTDFLNKKV